MKPLSGALEDALRPGAVTATAGGARADVGVLDLDRLGVSVDGVRVRTDAPGTLERCAEALPGALDVLPEPPVPVEIDRGLGGAILRTPPRQREFYEVRTDGRDVSLEKLRVGPDGRARIPFTLTREQLGRVVDGLARALHPEDAG